MHSFLEQKFMVFTMLLMMIKNIVSVLGPDKGYTVKYKPLPEGVPESSPNTDIISFDNN